jgi:hypothetical protein
MPSDDEILVYLRKQNSPIIPGEAGSVLGTQQERIRRIARQNGLRLAPKWGTKGSRTTEGMMSIVGRECIIAQESGDGLDNPLGQLLALICGVPFDAVVEMNSGGTVTIAIGDRPIQGICGRKVG